MDVAEVRSLVVARLPPRYEPLQLTFYGEQTRPSGDHVIIGDDYGTELRVRLSDGAVLSIDPQGELRSRFVNSSVERLADFIEVHRSYSGRAGTDLQVASVARQLRQGMEIIDPAAFLDPENWWAVVVEQAEDGLL